jgi:serine/threonine protein kinase/peptidoglycan hydrolase-like protein with peptidoglycan-binding domain
MTTNVTSQGQAPEVDFVALQPGQTIGRYEIVSILGQGGFGITYRARDAQLDREVAIKEYLPSALAVRQDGVTVLPRTTKLADDFTWGRQRFVEEGRTLATLQRAPAIVRVFDFLEANGTAYIIMELVPGETLENRLKSVGKFGPADVDRILWPLLEGLEQVHNAGFLHRDIKPANILLGADGNPTLIDFGASRAAMAGRTAAMTAIFTPGYAAAEQMTSAKQGPWTDIYGVSATLYHAITGAPPPSAFDRMLEDAYEPLSKLLPAGFAPGLLIGIDAGLAVRATDRPQSIAGWRPILGQAGTPDTQATMELGHRAATAATLAPPRAPPTAGASAAPPAKGKTGLWAGIAAVLLLLAGGGYYFATKPAMPVVTADPDHEAAEQKAEQERQELARLRAEAAAREKAEQEAALRRQVEEDTRKKLEAEAAAKRQAEDDARRAAEAAEAGLRLSPADHQRVQVALTALGFDTGGADGVFNPRTREMIASWQGAKSYAPTSFLTGTQHQALLREASPALAKYDDDQRKLEEARKKAEEEKAKAAQLPPLPPPQAPQQAAVAPPTPSGPATGVDGLWRGAYHCGPGRGGGDFTIHLQIQVAGGSGTWTRPGSGPGTTGNQSLTIRINGPQVVVLRYHALSNQQGVYATGTMIARHENGIITGTGPEQNSGGRTCTINLTR